MLLMDIQGETSKKKNSPESNQSAPANYPVLGQPDKGVSKTSSPPLLPWGNLRIDVN
jgi:hypothetical protein